MILPPWTPDIQFRLYPEEARWWSSQDYHAVVEITRALQPGRVLEFGPGSSTLALIEGGAGVVDTCEDAPDWAQVYEERLVGRFPDVVRLHRYEFADPLVTVAPEVDAALYDLALIDGPRGTPSRPAVLRYALARSLYVLMPCEEWRTDAWLRPIISEQAAEVGAPVEFFETGPLSGAFALVGPTC